MAAGKSGMSVKQGSGAFERPTLRSTVILSRLWKYLCAYKWLLLLALLFSVAGNLFALIGPKLSGYAIDAIRPGYGKVNFQQVYYFCGCMIVFYIISSALSYLLAALMVKISCKAVYQMRRDVYNHIMKLPVSYFDSHSIGDMLSVLSYDIDTINASLSNDLVQMLASLITVIGSLIIMTTISPALMLTFAVTVPISIWFTNSRSKKVRPLYRKRSQKLGELNGYAEEMTGGLKTIRVYHRQQVFCDKFQQKNSDACEANYLADRLSSSTGPSVSAINNLSLALISIFGALLYMAGSISLGGVSSFVLYSRKFSGPINEFSNIISELQSALAAAERMFKLLDEPTEKPDDINSETLNNVRGEVKLTDVYFGYDSKSNVLNGCNLTAKAGQIIAIVGPTGAGKTTIINLLMRFYDANKGTITIDGKDIYKLSKSSLRSAFSMVLQDTWLNSGSIYENLAYGKEGVTREEVINAAKAAKIHSFINSLPKGYDTLLQDGGNNISKGQKQLLTISRAMLIDAPMLILDEATSNVDTQTERKIQAAMLKLMEGKTCFVIAHRLSTIRNADLIAVLQNGTFIECGTHLQLMKLGGYYSRLYRLQYEQAENI